MNFRFEGAGKGRAFHHILVFGNTFYGRHTHGDFVVESDFQTTQGNTSPEIYVRGNIFASSSIVMPTLPADLANGFHIDGNCHALAPAVGAGSIVADPKFVNSTEWDFELQEDSPCRGISSANLERDLLGSPRDENPDAGAFEFIVGGGGGGELPQPSPPTNLRVVN